MIVHFETRGDRYSADLSRPIEISIPLDFSGPQPNAYGVEPAISRACEYGELIGDTRRGGSCNFEEVRLIPHCNGTHTEGVGHLTNTRISLHECLVDSIFLAGLVTVEPVSLESSGETYGDAGLAGDLVITGASLSNALSANVDGLIIRTIPNPPEKMARRYVDEVPPYLTFEAMTAIRGAGLGHLLVDLPSIDRLYDHGKLDNHRIFWDIPRESHEISAKTRVHTTITELIFVPDQIADGLYLVNLQIPPFAADAAPSRPRLFAPIV